MVFDKLKKLFAGSRPSVVVAARTDDAAVLQAALLPLVAHSRVLADRCVAFVRDGSDPGVLWDLEQAANPELVQLLHNPARLDTWWWAAESTRKAWEGLGLTPDHVLQGRHNYYGASHPPEELVRLGRLLAALATEVNRQADGVPLWLTALLNDVVATIPNRAAGRESIMQALPQWQAGFVVQLLTVDGEAGGDEAAVALRALIQASPDSGYRRFQPHELPGVRELILSCGRLSPSQVAGLNAEARVWLMQKAADEVGVGEALSDVVAAYTVDTAKSVRAAALNALSTLSQECRAEAIVPVLARASASRAADLVEALSRDSQGTRLLAEAVEGGAKIGALVAQSTQRMEAIEAKDDGQPVLVPPFTPLPDTPAGPEVVDQLRAALDAEIARAQGKNITWAQRAMEKARGINRTQLEQVVAAANGAQVEVKLLKEYNLWWLSNAAPSLNLIHLLRLARYERFRRINNALYVQRAKIHDLRVADDAAHRAGVHADQIGDAGISDDDLAAFGMRIAGECAWPWFAERPWVLERWFAGDAERVGDALVLLVDFPQLPSQVLPLVAKVALSESRTNRPRAQAALSGHPAAPALAVQGLTDGKGEVRAAAAAWIAADGMTDGVEPLRRALAKEKREGARAAMLTALEQLGDDISAHLTPEKLYAEAAKGLKAKPPASMSWLNLDQLPAVRWADAGPAEPALLRWWFVLAVKLKNPDGSGLFDRYLSLLDADDAAEVGRVALRSWIAQDTCHPEEAESRAHAEAMGPQRWRDAQDLVQRLKVNPKVDVNWLRYAEERAALPVEQFVAEVFRQEQAVYLGSAIADKGMLALTTRMPGVELAAAVQSYIRAHGARRAQVEALVHTLFANADPAAIQLLLSIARRFKQVTVQARARELVERLADERGWSADELADRTIPTAGFSDDKMLHLSFGEREFLGRVNPKFGIDLTDPDGKPIKALPGPRVSDDAEVAADAKKQLSASRKELKAVLTLQSARLYEAMCGGRSWLAPVWQEYVLGHPLMSQLATRLIWSEVGAAGERRFRPTEDGELIDLNDEPIELDGVGEVRLAHRVHMGPEEAGLWRAHLADYGMTALFDQLSATVPEHEDGATALENLKGHMTDTFSFRGVATKRGYTRGMAEDAGWFTEYTKPFSSTGLTAVLEFTGSYLPEDNIPCATESLCFRRGYTQVSLAEVPPVLLAECYADYAAMAALGPFDPAYRDKAGI